MSETKVDELSDEQLGAMVERIKAQVPSDTGVKQEIFTPINRAGSVTPVDSPPLRPTQNFGLRGDASRVQWDVSPSGADMPGLTNVDPEEDAANQE